MSPRRPASGHIGYGMGVAAGDYDNDGFLDLYVTNFGRNVLYHNNGDGTFTDVTREAGVDDPHWSTSAAWVDFDGDGWLDLFVCNYVDFTVEGNRGCSSPAGQPDYCTPKMYHAVPSRLFRNLRNGKFEDITEASGINRAYGPALGVVCADFNGDGRTDIYVANDTAANHLWLNQGDGTFREAALDYGVAYSMDGLAKAGMGVTLGGRRKQWRPGAAGDQSHSRGSHRFPRRCSRASSMTSPPNSACCSRHSATRASVPSGSTTITTAGSISSSRTAA